MPTKQKETPPKNILIVGDWVVDDIWLIGKNQSTPRKRGMARHHYRSLQRPDSIVRRLGGVGQVAKLLFDAQFGSTTLGNEQVLNSEQFSIHGLGLWHPADTDYLRMLFYPWLMAGRVPFKIDGPRELGEVKKDPRLSMTCIDALLDPKFHKPIFSPKLDSSFQNYESVCKQYDKDIKVVQQFGTPRVFRTFVHSTGGFEQMARVDWQILPNENNINRKFWVQDSDANRLSQMKVDLGLDNVKFDAVIVKDLGKGVVSKGLFEYLFKRCSSNLSAIPWFVSSRRWHPEWLDFLAENAPIKLLFYGTNVVDPADNSHDVATWLTPGGVPSLNAIKALETQKKLLDVRSDDFTIVVNPNQLRLLAYHFDKSNRQHPVLTNGFANPKQSPLHLSIGLGSVIFGALSYGLLQQQCKLKGSCNDGPGVGGGLNCLLDSVLGAANQWALEEAKSFNEALQSPQPPRRFVLAYRPGPDYRIAIRLPKEKGSLALTEADRQALVKDLESVLLPDYQQNWEDAEHSLIGVYNRNQSSTFDPAWGTIDLSGYVCLHPKKRTCVTNLMSMLKTFHPSDEKKSLSALLSASPGAGKSHLVKQLEREFREYLVVRINITNLGNRDELIDCFDEIVTIQAGTRAPRVLVFVDEINAKISGHHVYDTFLTPLSDGYYMRGGKRFIIRPCIWLFAGTDDKKAIEAEPSGNKGSDFISRLSESELSLRVDITKNMENQLHWVVGSNSNTDSKFDDMRWLIRENVYLGIAKIRSEYPDVKRIHKNVFMALACLRPTAANRDVQRFVEKHLMVTQGMATFPDLDSVKTCGDAIFGLQRNDKPEEIIHRYKDTCDWVDVILRPTT